MTWHFVVNNNGNTHDDIKRRFVAVVEASQQLEKALAGLHEVTNGRNYQTLPDGGHWSYEDQDMVRTMQMRNRQINDVAVAGAALAIRQREGL
jgi:hypothetical protein